MHSRSNKVCISGTAPQALHFALQNIKMKTDKNRNERVSFREESLLEGPLFHLLLPWLT